MNTPPGEIILTQANVIHWPKYNDLFAAAKLKADSTGRLRYLHGAPVGKLKLLRINNNGTPIYVESADEWFDPESQKGEQFIWP